MEKGRINIPTDEELSINSSEADIKNYIVQQFINASLKPSTLMETSMPTGTLQRLKNYPCNIRMRSIRMFTG
jgi:hypothetical protein